MKRVTIIGFGRFGKVLERLFRDDFEVVVWTRKSKEVGLEKAYQSDAIFFAVPISEFERVIKEHRKYFRENSVLIDVLSVKMHPKSVFEKYLKKTKVQAMLTHPMFGPDSSKNGFENLPMIMDRFKASLETYNFWKKFFQNKKLNVIEMTAEKHDELAAKSQGLTHFIGRLLEEFKFGPTPIDSLGAKKLLEVMEQTCNDTWELFNDLQHYNPYTKEMRLKLGKSYDDLYNKLLPKKVDDRFITFGIQGGKGSFNEVAIQSYLRENNIQNYVIKYLYTSEKVLKNLHTGAIDFGIFAIQNSTGGIVAESVVAMSRYKFKIISQVKVMIRHFLMKRKDVRVEDIKSVMAHSQNFLQCSISLSKKWSHLKQETGSGDLMDTAKAAEFLSLGKLPNTAAILGPKILSEMYDLEIIDEDLQDKKDNLTDFLLVSR